MADNVPIDLKGSYYTLIRPWNIGGHAFDKVVLFLWLWCWWRWCTYVYKRTTASFNPLLTLDGFKPRKSVFWRFAFGAFLFDAIWRYITDKDKKKKQSYRSRSPLLKKSRGWIICIWPSAGNNIDKYMWVITLIYLKVHTDLICLTIDAGYLQTSTPTVPLPHWPRVTRFRLPRSLSLSLSEREREFGDLC